MIYMFYLDACTFIRSDRAQVFLSFQIMVTDLLDLNEHRLSLFVRYGMAERLHATYMRSHVMMTSEGAS